MSKIGNQAIKIIEGVKLELKPDQIKVIGPKGELSQSIDPLIKVELKDNQLVLSRRNESRPAKAMHGLTRTLIANMIIGVTQGFTKTLEVEGTGYRVTQAGRAVSLTLGFSHPVKVEPPVGIKLEAPDNKTIIISGINKQQVGQIAAEIRALKKPDPYKAKGVHYQGEHIRRKAGKAGKASEAAGG